MPQPASASGVPNAPSNLQLNPPHTVSGTLSWSDNSSNETRFEIWRLVTAPPPYNEQYAIRGANTTSQSVTAPYPYTSYYTIYTVKACNSYGCASSSGLATYVDTSTPTPTPTPTPLAGSYDWEPEEWNYQPVQSQNNCFNYALDDIRTSYGYIANTLPYQFDDDIVSSCPYPNDPYAGYYTCDSSQHVTALNWYEAAIADGFIFRGLNLSQVTDGTRLVALGGQTEFGHFHFLRLDSNATWSQKSGGYAPTNTVGGDYIETDEQVKEVIGDDYAPGVIVFVGYFKAPLP